jgi:murein DD-endopeptidase MepM/ murein hydrolase activator NlpD
MMEINQKISSSFLETPQDIILTRSILLFFGSFVTLLFLMSFFRSALENVEPAHFYPQVHNIADIRSSDDTPPNNTNVNSSENEPDIKTNDNIPNSSVTVKIPSQQSFEIKIARHQNIQQLLKEKNIPSKEAQELMKLPQVFPILSKLIKGKTLLLKVNKDRVQLLQYPFEKGKTLVIERHNDHFLSHITHGVSTETYKTVRGTIHHSAISSLVSSGLPHDLFYHLQAIFQNQVEISALPSNTDFKIVLKESRTNGKKATAKEILGAKFVTPTKTYVMVENKTNKGLAQYYTPSGQTLEKGFLRLPVHYREISSPFNPGRYHPILHIYRPHNGVDLAAPYGTPVKAASDGLITCANYENGFGNVLKLKFNSQLTTIYGHLGHFARGIHVGQHVKEGQVVAYVGSTGLSTGAHLHYEFHVNGKAVNPLTVNLPGSHSLSASARQSFKEYAKRLFA